MRTTPEYAMEVGRGFSVCVSKRGDSYDAIPYRVELWKDGEDEAFHTLAKSSNKFTAGSIGQHVADGLRAVFDRMEEDE
ncbi:MAG: hypothetical protein OXE96_16205 [Gemmatimonadetes bacterium]|nr:hypothetical protein [Gemmatimonadota bacterium]